MQNWNNIVIKKQKVTVTRETINYYESQTTLKKKKKKKKNQRTQNLYGVYNSKYCI